MIRFHHFKFQRCITAQLGFLFILASINSFADEQTTSGTEQYKKAFKQSHLSCSIITSEHLTILQLYQRGLPKQLAIDSLPNISRGAKKRVDYVYNLAKDIGILNAYADINTNYARCSTLVHKIKGKPAVDQKEYAYYYCSGENKLRFELILQIDQRHPINSIYEKAPSTHYTVVQDYLKLVKTKGMLAAFDLTANNLKSCLKQIE